ncbi:MAG: glycosyltransferase [Faecalibacterium sp.]
MDLRWKRAKELAGYAVQLTKEEGALTMLRRGAGFVRRRCFGSRARYLPSKKVLQAQRAEMMGKTAQNCGLPTISVVTPLYNTPEKYLREFLESFVSQTAPNGQLCLADASDAAHPQVEQIVREYQSKNKRIVYQKVENLGIAANTNAAAALASGEYLALADHDDLLAPHALYTMGKAILQLRQSGQPDGFLYSDEALFHKSMRRPQTAHFKPDYAPDYLLCCNYICHLAVFRRQLYQRVGGERPECDGSQDHDLFLRLIEQTGGAAHVPQVLYYWRVHQGSTSGGTEAKPYVAAAAKKALADHLARTGCAGTVEDGLFPSTYRIRWDIEGQPKVSILIPNKDHAEDLEKCLHSIWARTQWENYEVIVIENNSTDPATFAYYQRARQRYDGLKVVTWPEKGFNFSAINNYGRRAAQGQYLLLLNNDVEVLDGAWLTELLRQCARKNGAAVCGAMLYYPDDTIQHAGVVTGLGGYAGHSHKYKRRGGSGYMFRAATVQDFSAVTGACLLVKASVWDALGGLDEAFAVAFNDVDFCLRVRKSGGRIAWTPYAQLYHYESKSRGGDEKDPVKAARFAREQKQLYEVHGRENILHDPYYNPNLTSDREDFSESNDLRALKEGRVSVRFLPAQAAAQRRNRP